MLASNRKNQIFVGSWFLIIVGAVFAYFDIFPPETKRVFGYVWLMGVLIQLGFGLFWTVVKYRNKDFSFQRGRHNPTKIKNP